MSLKFEELSFYFQNNEQRGNVSLLKKKKLQWKENERMENREENLKIK